MSRSLFHCISVPCLRCHYVIKAEVPTVGRKPFQLLMQSPSENIPINQRMCHIRKEITSVSGPVTFFDVHGEIRYKPLNKVCQEAECYVTSATQTKSVGFGAFTELTPPSRGPNPQRYSFKTEPDCW